MEKNRPKKLVLSLETVRKLNNGDLEKAAGGKNKTAGPGCYQATYPDTVVPCYTC